MTLSPGSTALFLLKLYLKNYEEFFQNTKRSKVIKKCFSKTLANHISVKYQIKENKVQSVGVLLGFKPEEGQTEAQGPHHGLLNPMVS